MFDGSTSRRIAVVANPGSGNAGIGLDAALNRLQRAGVATVRRPEGDGGIARAVEAAGMEGYDIVLAGGDGTVNAALPALRKVDRPFGLLPMGTANDFARTLGIPTDPEKAAAIVAAGHTRRIDMSTVNGHPFVNVASIGLAVEVALRHRGPRKRRLGVLNYPLVWWEAFRATRPFRVRVTCDGTTIETRCIMLAVGNGRHYGGGLTIHEDARIDDGQLTLYFVKSAGSLQLVKMLPAFFVGTLYRQERAVSLCGRRIRVETRRAKRVDADGEIVTETPAEFEIFPGALRVFAPLDEARA
ncbi:MAG: lipid kinase [Alphaproteobacteria bacterium]